MSAPIAGNQYFSNVENLLGSLTQLNVANLKSGGDALVANNFSANGVVLNVSPNLANLTADSTGLTDGDALADSTAYLSGFAGAGTVSVTLPEAAAGSSIVIIQDSAYSNTNALTFTTTTPSGSTVQDVFAVGQNLLSADGTDITLVTSTTGQTGLVFTPAAAAENIFGVLSRLEFTCVKAGEWNVTQILAPESSVVAGSAIAGTFAFS